MNEKQTYKLTAVGLGPGDPELISVKGLKALQNAEEIFFPASKVDGDQINSHSLKIISTYELKGKLTPLHIPMTGKNREEMYDAAYELIKSSVLEGKKVAVVSEGELLFYSTFGYILRRAQRDAITCDCIPGIPAFAHAGSAGQVSIVEGEESFKVLAKPATFEQIEKELQEEQSLVVMKMKFLKGWPEFLRKQNRNFVYVEKLGTTEEFVCSNPDEMEGREIPYFSLILFTR